MGCSTVVLAHAVPPAAIETTDDACPTSEPARPPDASPPDAGARRRRQTPAPGTEHMLLRPRSRAPMPWPASRRARPRRRSTTHTQTQTRPSRRDRQLGRIWLMAAHPGSCHRCGRVDDLESSRKSPVIYNAPRSRYTPEHVQVYRPVDPEPANRASDAHRQAALDMSRWISFTRT